MLRPLSEDSITTDERPDDGPLFVYTIILNVERRESLESLPPQIGFDLIEAPRTICLHLAGGYLMHSVKSNVVTVSAKSIEEAVTRYRDKRPRGSSNTRFKRSQGPASVGQGKGR
jgi:hypothetical protein